jgi:hypothetical protein
LDLSSNLAFSYLGLRMELLAVWAISSFQCTDGNLSASALHAPTRLAHACQAAAASGRHRRALQPRALLLPSAASRPATVLAGRHEARQCWSLHTTPCADALQPMLLLCAATAGDGAAAGSGGEEKMIIF